MKFPPAHERRKGGRPYSQARLAAARSGEALLMVLADGMGGYAGGELAAQAGVDCVAEAFGREAGPRLADADAFLARIMGAAHLAIVQKGLGEGMEQPPRTTLVACVVQSGYAHWSFIGDSRLYLIRKGRVAARTRDHSIV